MGRTRQASSEWHFQEPHILLLRPLLSRDTEQVVAAYFTHYTVFLKHRPHRFLSTTSHDLGIGQCWAVCLFVGGIVGVGGVACSGSRCFQRLRTPSPAPLPFSLFCWEHPVLINLGLPLSLTKAFPPIVHCLPGAALFIPGSLFFNPSFRV